MEYKFETLLFEKKGPVGIMTLNRPKTLNSSNMLTAYEVDKMMDMIAEDDEVKSFIVTGGTKVFAAGGDIPFMSTASPVEMDKFIYLCNRGMDKLANMHKPSVAAIGGLALGGGNELAMCCDIRIASEGTIFGQPEINLGIMPGAGGTQRLSRIVGMGWAKYLILSGRTITADEALKIGLVTQIVPVDSLMDTAMKLAKELAYKAPLAMAAAKKCIDYGADVDIQMGEAFEQKTWAWLYSTEDQTEGMTAFLEKRKPQYKGK